MGNPRGDRPIDSLSRDELLDLVRRQEGIIEALKRRVAELEAEVERLCLRSEVHWLRARWAEGARKADLLPPRALHARSARSAAMSPLAGAGGGTDRWCYTCGVHTFRRR